MFSVVIPWRTDSGHRQQVFDWVLERWCMIYGEEHVEIAYGDSGDSVFSRSRSRNELFKRTSGDVVVFADADTVPIRAFVDKAVEIASEGNWCIAYGRKGYFNLTEDATNRYLALSPMTEISIPKEGEYEHQLLSWAGMFAVRRENFVGYDERFVGWGHEDVAFRLAMDNLVGKHDRVEDGYAVHLWHPRQEATFDTEVELKNRELFEKEYRKKYAWKDERV